MKKQWVDVPSGWKYGFPKVWDGQGNIVEWAVSNGYPKMEVEALGENFWYRQWIVENQDEASP